MAHDLLLATEVVGVTFLIAREVVAGATVAQQEWVTAADGLALALQAEVGVLSIEDPNTRVVALGVHSGLIETRDRRVVACALGGRGKAQGLAESVRVALNSDLLAIPDDVVVTKDIDLFSFDDAEDGAVSRPDSLVGRCREHVTLFDARKAVVDVQGKPAVSLRIAEHEAVAGADLAILGVGPGHLFVGDLVQIASLRER